MIMPQCFGINPADSTSNTRPSAMICAETQPRYEITMQIVHNTSTVRL